MPRMLSPSSRKPIGSRPQAGKVPRSSSGNTVRMPPSTAGTTVGTSPSGALAWAGTPNPSTMAPGGLELAVAAAPGLGPWTVVCVGHRRYLDLDWHERPHRHGREGLLAVAPYQPQPVARVAVLAVPEAEPARLHESLEPVRPHLADADLDVRVFFLGLDPQARSADASDHRRLGERLGDVRQDPTRLELAPRDVPERHHQLIALWAEEPPRTSFGIVLVAVRACGRRGRLGQAAPGRQEPPSPCSRRRRHRPRTADAIRVRQRRWAPGLRADRVAVPRSPERGRHEHLARHRWRRAAKRPT